jgi:hypothetical protein
MDGNFTKRLTKDATYMRPQKTYTDNLSNQDIKEKLKDYKKVSDIRTISIGSHIRYFTIDPKTKEKVFRLGGMLNKIDPEGRFIVLSNGQVTWSVQIPNSVFWVKMSESEYKEELKKEIKKEVITETDGDSVSELKKELKELRKELDSYRNMEKEYKNLVKNNETLNYQLTKIKDEIKKNKNKK